MNKNNKIAKFNIYKKFNNNDRVFYISKSPVKKNKENVITDKINQFLNSPFYIYGVDVVINLNGKIINDKVIGCHERELITVNNKNIKIADISDIYLKKD